MKTAALAVSSILSPLSTSGWCTHILQPKGRAWCRSSAGGDGTRSNGLQPSPLLCVRFVNHVEYWMASAYALFGKPDARSAARARGMCTRKKDSDAPSC